MQSVDSIAAIPKDLIWRLDVEKYHAMIEAGILTDDDPVELLEGWLVFKMPKNPRHRAATKLVREAIEERLPEDWYVDSQEPITIGNSEPEPDVVVVRGDTRQYLDRHPGPADIGLVVEVSDTTLDRDRGVKKQAYARAGIPIYWIVNLVDSQVEVYSQPSEAEADYLLRQDYGLLANLPIIFNGIHLGTVNVAALFP
jgi:Uma2 family endonuclease